MALDRAAAVIDERDERASARTGDDADAVVQYVAVRDATHARKANKDAVHAMCKKKMSDATGQRAYKSDQRVRT